jgi:cytoskeletal protein RodZ
MQKISQFKSVLSTVDTIINILIVLIVLASVILAGTTSLWMGGIAIIYAVTLWIIKVLSFGISYAVIQIAENTESDKNSTNSVKAYNFHEVVHKNKVAEFVSLYIEDDSYSNDPALIRIFNNISNDILLESTSNLEYAIRQMVSK